MRTFQVLCCPDPSGDTTLIEKDAKTTDGQSMLDFMFEFDRSVVAYEFTVPPELDAFYEGEDRMELTETQSWVIARMMMESFRAGWEFATPDED